MRRLADCHTVYSTGPCISVATAFRKASKFLDDIEIANGDEACVVGLHLEWIEEDDTHELYITLDAPWGDDTP